MILSLAVSCRWRQGQRGGRGSRAAVREPARPGESGPAVAGRSGQPAGAHGAGTGRRAATLVEPQQAGLWLAHPVLVLLVGMPDQRQGRHLLVLEQVRRLDLNRFGLAPCGKDHRFVLEHLLIDVEGCA